MTDDLDGTCNTNLTLASDSTATFGNNSIQEDIAALSAACAGISESMFAMRERARARLDEVRKSMYIPYYLKVNDRQHPDTAKLLPEFEVRMRYGITDKMLSYRMWLNTDFVNQDLQEVSPTAIVDAYKPTGKYSDLYAPTSYTINPDIDTEIEEKRAAMFAPLKMLGVGLLGICSNKAGFYFQFKNLECSAFATIFGVGGVLFAQNVYLFANKWLEQDRMLKYKLEHELQQLEPIIEHENRSRCVDEALEEIRRIQRENWHILFQKRRPGSDYIRWRFFQTQARLQSRSFSMNPDFGYEALKYARTDEQKFLSLHALLTLVLNIKFDYEPGNWPHYRNWDFSTYTKRDRGKYRPIDEIIEHYFGEISQLFHTKAYQHWYTDTRNRLLEVIAELKNVPADFPGSDPGHGDSTGFLGLYLNSFRPQAVFRSIVYCPLLQRTPELHALYKQLEIIVAMYSYGATPKRFYRPQDFEQDQVEINKAKKSLEQLSPRRAALTFSAQRFVEPDKYGLEFKDNDLGEVYPETDLGFSSWP